jgi:hypothetical protein
MTTRYTPGPWAAPYVDQLPNNLRSVRIDSRQETGVSIVALLPIGDGSDLEINAIQRANARLIAAAPDMRLLLSQAMVVLELEHVQDVADEIRALLARIDGDDTP